MISEDHSAAYAKYLNKDLTLLSSSSSMADVESLYDKWASDYEKNCIDAGAVFQIQLAEAFNSLPGMSSNKSAKIIDIAAGTGLIGVELFKRGYTNIDALDVSQGMLDEAKKKNVYGQLLCTSISENPTPGIACQEYDVVILNGALSIAHVKPGAVDEMLRMTKPGGVISFTIRPDQLPHYEGKFKELEERKKWKLMKQDTLKYFENNELPASCIFYGYTKCH